MAIQVGGITVIGNDRSLSNVTVNLVTSTSSLALSAATNLTASIAGAERLRIDASGNLGLGSTGPSLGGGATRKEIAISGSTDAYVTFNASNGFNGYIGGSGGGITVASTIASPLVLATNGAERVRIHASGGVSIGNTTDPGASNLSVTGNISVTGTVDGRDLSVDGAKLDGIAAGATANQGTVTSVSGTGSYGGLTLSGTVNTNGSLTLGGTPTGTWPISITGAASGSTFSSDATTKDDITTRTETGFYETSTGTLAEGWPTNTGGWHHLIASTHSNDANYFSMQLSSTFFDQQLYFRATNGSGTTAWSTLLHSGNYSSYALPLSGGTITGNLSVTGSVRSGAYLDASGGNTATINGSLPALNKAASALTDGATITIDMVNGPNFSITLGGNRVLANPTNQVVGSSGFIVVSQDGTGSRTLSYGTAWKWIGGQTPLLTTTASARDVILYTVLASNDILASIARTV